MNPQQLTELVKLIQNGSKICIDSRKTAAGDIFFALKGDHTDGNRFAEKAIETGCTLAVIDDPSYNKGERYFVVENALKSLQQLAIIYRTKFDIPFLGITGTNGKTTTKELTQAVLSQSFASSATQGNLNNHIGVPLTLLSLKNTSELAIIEMGANHIGEIAHLSALARPTHAIITNIGKAHLEGFRSVDNIEKAKSELYQFVSGNNGVLFVNHDDERRKKHAGSQNAITYGTGTDCHCSGIITDTFPFINVSFKVNKGFGKAAAGIEGEIRSKLTGSYNFGNIMAALTTGLYFGVPASSIIRAIEAYEPKNSRSQIIKKDSNTILMDAYNANPTSMAAALQNFINYPGEKKAVLLGDMLELGQDAIAEHKAVFQSVNENNFTLKVFVGDIFSKVCENATNTKVFKNVNEAAEWLNNNQIQGHHILIKGSRGIQMEKLLECL
jgi:UDP-N-acetylmuramoyl-tripeptide--D-alanyl-D-alanine ligase